MTLITKFKLKNAFIYYAGLNHQIEAIKYLETKLTIDQLSTFAKIFSPLTSLSNFKLVNAFKYFNKDIEQHKKALQYLENIIDDKLLIDFATKFSPQKKDDRKLGLLADQVYRVCQERNYPLWKKPGQINICGLEGVNPDGTPNLDEPDRWNDLVGLLSFNDGVPYWVCIYVGTTEPGQYYTTNRLNPRGAARLDTGYHPGLWGVGKHRGYTALEQVGTARLCRDNNNNHRRDDAITFEKYRGVNLHGTKVKTLNTLYLPVQIHTWSAGCIVVRHVAEFQNFMYQVLNSQQYLNNSKYLFDFRLIYSSWL